ncbi:MAG: MaoC family dehydratase [Phycisphaerales bacterium]|nr:MaoC family dehydratase [Phycisphaerales bacterium]
MRLPVRFETILAYAEITGDYNPIHVDPEFAARSPMKGVIAHGTMSMNLLWQSIAATLGEDALRRTVLDVKFVRPVQHRRHRRRSAGGGSGRPPRSAWRSGCGSREASR